MGSKLESASIRYIRGAKRVEIHNPDANLVEVAGGNGEGKSSIMDSIEWGIRGRRAQPVDILHHGATAGYVKVKIGQLVITRKVTEANAARGGTAKIVAEDGSKWGEKNVEQLWGAWTFDPWAFARMTPEEQVRQVQQLLGREFTTELGFLDERLAVFRERRTAAGQRERAFGRVELPPETQGVDTEQLIAKLRETEQWNAEQERLGTIRKMAAHSLGVAQQEYDHAAELMCRAESLLERAKAEFNEAPVPKEKVDVTELQRMLSRAGETNRMALEYEQAKKRFAEWQACVREHEQLDQEVKDAEERRKQHLRTAKLPMPGLAWEGGAITVNGTPFKGLCTTEQLLMSARIGMAASPELRVMLVREGALLDDDHFALLLDLAKRGTCVQCGVERRDLSDEVCDCGGHFEGYQLIVETAGKGHTKDALIVSGGELDDAETWTSSDDWE